MWRISLILCFVLAACGTNSPAVSISSVEAPIVNAQSAVVNLNILNRDATLSALVDTDDLLFSAQVEDIDTVDFVAEIGEQTFIALTDNLEQVSSHTWSIKTSPQIPISYVVDVTDGSLDANLSGLAIPRFDAVATSSELDIEFPASSIQIVVDASDSTSILMIPDNAQIQSAQFTSNGGLMTLSVAQNVRFIGNLSVTSGGLTLRIPPTTGVQLIVERAGNSEITLPDSPRAIAEENIYTTPNFDQTDTQILLHASLSGAAIRIVQE